MNLMQFAEKAGYMKDGLLNKPIKEVEKKFKENIKMQKRYFAIKRKDFKSDNDNSFLVRYADGIIW